MPAAEAKAMAFGGLLVCLFVPMNRPLFRALLPPGAEATAVTFGAPLVRFGAPGAAAALASLLPERCCLRLCC